jgi:hypothetical protein
LLAFVFLARRSALGFQPLRDYEVFIHRIDEPEARTAAVGR